MRYWLLGIVLMIGLAVAWPITRAVMPSSTQVSSSNLSVMLVGLGGTRGILSEILWWRINELQRQGRNTEVYPLTQLLTELDPSTPNVAVFNAWNCAYNIACTYDNAEDRWTWMKRGHRLLVDGLNQHPTDENALREMVAFWQIKFYGNVDPFQAYYNQHVAEIPMDAAMVQTLRENGLPEDPNIAALRLYAWAHRAGFNRDERFAVMRLLEIYPRSSIPHRAFAEAYVTACRDRWLIPEEARTYQNVALRRLYAFPNDPYLQQILSTHVTDE